VSLSHEGYLHVEFYDFCESRQQVGE
jgi:hypothetical protein